MAGIVPETDNQAFLSQSFSFRTVLAPCCCLRTSPFTLLLKFDISGIKGDIEALKTAIKEEALGLST
jgi:hypothetical protein